MWESRLFPANESQRSALHFESGEGGNDRCVEAWRRLLGQVQLELMEEDGLLRFRLGVPRHSQSSTVGGRKRNIEHLNRAEFLQHRARCQAWGMHLQPVLQRDGQAVGQKCDQDMRFDSMFQLMVDRPDA